MVSFRGDDVSMNSGVNTAGDSRGADLRSGPRHLMESLICLLLAVILFRTFQLEGYMISTGSMAPHLLGFHRRVQCPKCGYLFAAGMSEQSRFSAADRGAVEADSAAGDGSGTAAAGAGGALASCPNCGQEGIQIGRVPRNQGDQLLVHKNAYQFVEPRRWEVIVFRNPREPAQAYVKRIVGLPGETLLITDGDVYVLENGRFSIRRKDLDRQRAIRIPVYDHSFAPEDDDEGDWRSRWVVEEGDPSWTAFPGGFAFDGAGEEGLETETAWIGYRHWIRSGGTHRTSVKLPGEQRRVLVGLPVSRSVLSPLTYNPVTRTVSCYGALPAGERDRLLGLSDHPDLQRVVNTLYEKSHVAPITDEYGYNGAHRSEPPESVRDLMVSAEVTVSRGEGQFILQMTDGEQTFDCRVDAGRSEMHLILEGIPQAVRSVRLNPAIFRQPMRWEMSLFDRQVAVAVNGQKACDPVLLEEKVSAEGRPPERPVRLGARGLQVQVRSLRLFRDVYYTQKGEGEPTVLGENEYFVLGDNSPISADSRVWEQPAVHRRHLLGKPLVVHLPSRPGRVRIGDTYVQVRIPDVSRMHSIR